MHFQVGVPGRGLSGKDDTGALTKVGGVPSKAKRSWRLLKAIAKHPREVERFLNYNYPSSRDSSNLTLGTVAGDGEEALRVAVRAARGFNGPIIELGSLFGHSAFIIAEEKEQTQELICVDAYKWNPYGLSAERHRELLDFNLGHLYRTANTRLVSVGSNAEFFQGFLGPAPALVFIDAGHFYSEVKQDITWARSVGSKIICGDDFHFEGVNRAVVEIFGAGVDVVGDKFWRVDSLGSTGP